MNEFNLEPEVDAAAKRSSNWDRKLASSIMELQDLQSVMKKYESDPAEMRKQIKKVRKFHRSSLATIKVLDIPQETLTNSVEPAMLTDVDQDPQQT
jgi:hypothetical protein